MNPPVRRDDDRTVDLLVDIVTLLESHGVPSDSYQLYDAIDLEAVAMLVEGAAADTEVRFSVEGVELVVTPSGVGIARADSADPSEQ